MINLCNKLDKDCVGYYGNIYRSYFAEDKIGTIYGVRDQEYGAILGTIIPRPLDIVLDVGCGLSALILLLSKYAKKIYGIDNGSFGSYIEWFEDIKNKTELKTNKIELFEQSAKSIPLPGESVDIVYTVSALEHFNNDEDIMAAQEIGRVLINGGYFVGTVDYNFFTERPLGEEHFCRVYTLKSFMERIVKPSGLKLVGEIDLPLETNIKYIAEPLFFCLYKD